MNRAAAAAMTGALALAGAGAGCTRGSQARPVGGGGQAVVGGGQAVVDSKRLPEDPVAGRRSEAQWRDFMVAEERERQLGYDRPRLKQHQAVVKSLRDARDSLDAARTEVALERARGKMAAVTKDVQARTKAIDHWGVNSPLLPQYDALIAILSTSYPDARLAVLRGGRGREGATARGGAGGGDKDRLALEAVQSDVDQRLQVIANWLKEAADSESD